MNKEMYSPCCINSLARLEGIIYTCVKCESRWVITEEKGTVLEKANQDILKGCGKRLPTKKRQVRDSLVCNEYQLCDKCKVLAINEGEKDV